MANRRSGASIVFDFETTEYVCADCGGKEWHANRFFSNSLKQWQSDDIAQWCSDCETEVTIIPLDEYDEETDKC
jgi:hypothetical protein